jgi:hypothetical protein
MHVSQAWVDLGDLLILLAVLGGAALFLGAFGWHEVRHRHRPAGPTPTEAGADHLH